MPDSIDLHIHTSLSDGVLSPSDLVGRLKRSKLTAVAITDHDTLDGSVEVQSLLSDSRIELVSGVELSVIHGDDDLHILGYLFDLGNGPLNQLLVEFQQSRDTRARKIVEELADLGLKMPFDEVRKVARGSSIGRPHIAETLYRLGLTRSYLEAFHKYIGKGCPAYVPKTKLEPDKAIQMIHQAGGLAVLAHPVIDKAEKHLDMLVDLGLDGLELYHYSAKRKDRQRLKKAAEKRNLLLTGGSDFHGRDGTENTLGRSKVPLEYLDRMKDRWKQQRGAH